MSGRPVLVNAIAKVCNYALDLENLIITNKTWEWFEANKNHPDSEDCITTLDLLLCNESNFEGWESFCQVFGPIYRSDNPEMFTEVKDESGNAITEDAIVQWFENHIGDEVNMYVSCRTDYGIQWDNLNRLLESFRNGDDLSLAEILEEIRNQSGNVHGYYWEESDLADLKDTSQAIKIVEKLAAIDWQDVTADTVEVEILARWGQGEDLLYLKLGC